MSPRVTAAYGLGLFCAKATSNPSAVEKPSTGWMVWQGSIGMTFSLMPPNLIKLD